MKNLVIVLAVFVLILSCEKNDNTCNCDNPLEDLQWLKDLKSSLTNCSCQTSIIQGTYKNETVFFVSPTGSECFGNLTYVLRDCNGDTVKVFGPTFSDEVTDHKILYTCKEK
jgi:hypothetical protein